MLYRYETHCHTSEVSRCSRMSGADLVRFYKGLNFDGIFITDHFLNGNTYYNDPKVDWESRIKGFVEGYENAKIEGDRLGLDVFFAWEYTYHGTDYLTYGLDAEWLLAHPEVMEMTPNQYFDFVHSEGAFIVHAHPMRQAGYIPMICLFPDKVDAVEVDNASMKDIVNERGMWYAESYGLLKTAGSDTHFLDGRKRFAGVDSEVKFESPADYGKALREGKLTRISVSID